MHDVILPRQTIEFVGIRLSENHYYVAKIYLGGKCADVHSLWRGQREGTTWMLACARGHVAGAGGIGRQRGRLAGDAALPPQDTEEEVPLWGAGDICNAAGWGAALFEHAYSTLILAVETIGFYFHI